MKNPILAAVTAALLGLGAGTADATTWHYSFSFLGPTVTGTFQGDAVDGIIENITDASLVADGYVAFTHSDAVFGDLGGAKAFIAVDGSSYDFKFYGNIVDAVGGSANNKYVILDDGSRIDEFSAIVFNPNSGPPSVFFNDELSVVGRPADEAELPPLVISVPEPTSAALLLVGLAAMGFVVKPRGI